MQMPCQGYPVLNACTMEMYQQITAPAVLVVQEAALKGPVTPIKVYSCNLHILDPVEDS